MIPRHSSLKTFKAKVTHTASSDHRCPFVGVSAGALCVFSLPVVEM